MPTNKTHFSTEERKRKQEKQGKNHGSEMTSVEKRVGIPVEKKHPRG